MKVVHWSDQMQLIQYENLWHLEHDMMVARFDNWWYLVIIGDTLFEVSLC